MRNKRKLVYLKKFLGLDLMVWRTITVAILIPLIFLSYKLIKKDECIPVSFTAKSGSINTGNSFYKGEVISFRASRPGNNIVWDFEDGSTDKGEYVIHRFEKEGSYYVKVSSGACEIIQAITIIKPPIAPSGDENIGEKIFGNAGTFAGVEEIYQSMVKAERYEWVVLNRPDMKKEGQIVSFVFPIKGNYTIQLTLNNDRKKRYTKDVIVQELQLPVQKPVRLIPNIPPPQPDPIIPTQQVPKKEQKEEDNKVIPPVVEPATPPSIAKKIRIGEPAFADYLQMVVSGQMGESEFYKYLCGEGSTKVQYNKESALHSFSWLCQELNGKKKGVLMFKSKIKIKSVELRKDDDGCISLIVVKAG